MHYQSLALARVGRTDDAIAVLRKLVEAEKNCVVGYEGLATLLIAKGSFEEAKLAITEGKKRQVSRKLFEL